MMAVWGSFCTMCGIELSGDFPRTCSKGHVTYAAPQQVAVVLLPVMMADNGKGLLMIERTKTVGDVGLALPGGFVDDNETHARAARRELQEETGIELAEEDLCFFDEVIVPGRNGDPRATSLAFFVGVPIDQKIVSSLQPTEEVSGFKIVQFNQQSSALVTPEGDPVTLVFPAHQMMAQRYFMG